MNTSNDLRMLPPSLCHFQVKIGLSLHTSDLASLHVSLPERFECASKDTGKQCE